MMAQSRAESTRDTYNYGQYINQFPPNTIKVIREFERIQKKICRHKMSIMFNEICLYIIIIIMSCRQHGYPWPSLATSPISFIASGSSSGLHPVSSHSCCMYVRAGRPAFAWPYVGVHRSTSLTSSSLLLQQCPACLARLTCIVFVMGGKWLYSWRLVGCYRQDLFNIALNIPV